MSQDWIRNHLKKLDEWRFALRNFHPPGAMESPGEATTRGRATSEGSRGRRDTGLSTLLCFLPRLLSQLNGWFHGKLKISSWKAWITGFPGGNWQWSGFVVQIPDVRRFQRLVEERRLREEEEERERLEEERTPVFRAFVVDVVISECFELMFEIDSVHPTVTVTTGLLHFSSGILATIASWVGGWS